jgi:hypothetical protein
MPEGPGYDLSVVRRAYMISAVVIAAAAALLVVLAAGGLGGDTSREDFQTQVVHSRNRVEANLEFMVKAHTWDDLLERLDAAGAQAREAADDLADEGAPSDLEDASTELVLALRALGDELSATSEALDDPRFEGSSIQGLDFDNWNRVQRALKDLREQGIDVPPLERH